MSTFKSMARNLLLKSMWIKVIKMKFDICEVFSQEEENEIEKFLLEKIRNVPEEATISDVSLELHKMVESVLYEYEINMMT